METVFLDHFFAIGAVVLLLYLALLLLLFSRYYAVRNLKGEEKATSDKRMVFFFSLLLLLFLVNYLLIINNPHLMNRNGFKDIVFSKCCFLLFSIIFLYFSSKENPIRVRRVLNGVIIITALLLIFDDFIYFFLPEPFVGTIFKYYINLVLHIVILYKVIVGLRNKEYKTKRMRYLEVGFSSLFLLFLTLFFSTMVIKGDSNAMFLLFIILLVSLGLSLTHNPIIFKQQENYMLSKEEMTMELPDSTSKSKEGYDIVKQRLIAYFENEKPYLSPDISIGEVAVRIFTNKSYLSKTINIKMDKNFREFVNYYRIREAMRLYFADESLSTTELCSLCGFRNNASFTNAFKINTGCTPAEWCRSIKIRRSNGENFEIALSS